MDEIQRTLGKLLANQEFFMKALQDHIIDDKIMASRILSIENKLGYATGVVAAAIFVWGFVSHWVQNKLGFL